MKKLKQIIAQVKNTTDASPNEFNDLLWKLICYSPKMPVRLLQEQLLNEAEKFILVVNDGYFAKAALNFNGLKWGNGAYKVLLTHGWGSKAADFTEAIIALKQISGLQIISFDAPGNGSSDGELSNLLLYRQAVEAVIENFGTPDVMIGHSLGAMANVLVYNAMSVKPALLISITPLIRLKENFIASMSAAGVPMEAQLNFLEDFEKVFGTPASDYDLMKIYPSTNQTKHWLAYDENDQVSPYSYLKELLDIHPFIKSKNYPDTGHERLFKSEIFINDMVNVVMADK